MKLSFILFFILINISFSKNIAIIQNEEVIKELVKLSDTSSISSMEILEERVSGVKQLFSDKDGRSGVVDPRGAFPSIYQITTTQGLSDITNSEKGSGPFDDPAMMRCFTVEFGKLYLANLHQHLTGGQPSQGWQAYYDAAESGTPILEVLGIGVNVHVNLDLTQSLLNCEAPNEFRPDFMKGGTSLVTEIPKMSQDIYEIYGVDRELTEGFFKIFAVGNAGDFILDILGIESNTSLAIFQTLRYISFHYHSGLMKAKYPKWYSIFSGLNASLIRKTMQTTWVVSNFVIKEVLFEMQEHGFQHTSTHIGSLIWKAVKRIDFSFNLFGKDDEEDKEKQVEDTQESVDPLDDAFDM
ncbi:MAG: hypothetical protein KC646_13500 [Candidatus Cloacimonetes bacterium]|nr:hypothetical protein [Candidatus Cloacimonadota bacterium]